MVIMTKNMAADRDGLRAVAESLHVQTTTTEQRETEITGNSMGFLIQNSGPQ